MNLSLHLDFIEIAPAALSATSHIGPSTIQGAEQRGTDIPADVVAALVVGVAK
jgi:hypothetical protein